MDESTGIPTRPAGGHTALIDADPAGIPPVPPTPEPARHEPEHHFHNPLENVKAEQPGTHPIAYAALAIAALALLLSLLNMDRGGNDFRQVRIGNQDCVIGQQGDADVLYCRAGAVPPT